MTSRLLAPRRRRTHPAAPGATGSTAATPILDWHHPGLTDLAARVTPQPATGFLRAAHRLIAELIRPVYAMNDEQRVSTTIARQRGSCSQRMAVLEAVARSQGIPTRVRGRIIDGGFWYPRFPHLSALVPAEVVLAWPEFRIDGVWVPISELYGGLCVTSGFTNQGRETLFDAVSRTVVDWDGAASSRCGLSGWVRGDLGYFDSRDELFRRYGQTLCPAARWVADPVLSRHSA